MKIISKQNNSRMCVICGLDNPYGVQAPFYEMEDGSVMSAFCYRAEHQSYPGRVHGGLITAMLDELGCRAFWVEHPEALAVTLSLTTKYRKPVPYGVELRGRGQVLRATARFIESQAQILDLEGQVLAEAHLKYLHLPTEKITQADYHEEMCYANPDGRREL